MPKLQVEKQSSLQPQEAFEKVTKLLQDDKELKKLDPSYACQFDPGSLKGEAKGKMFKAQMTVSGKGAGSLVLIEVDLPLALSLAKGLVQKTLQRKLDDFLA
jgi:hypothetical protein